MAGQCCSASEPVAEMELLLNRCPCKKSELPLDGTEVSHFDYVLCLRPPAARYKKKLAAAYSEKKNSNWKFLMIYKTGIWEFLWAEDDQLSDNNTNISNISPAFNLQH